MHRIKKYVVPFIIVFAFVGVIVFCRQNGSFRGQKDENWQVDDIYGNWKVTRLIGLSKGTKDSWTYGNQVGRSFMISENKIVDSQLRGGNVQEQYSPMCYSMNVSRYEESNIDISTRENIAHFQTKKGIILNETGIADSTIFQGIFYDDSEKEDIFMANEFEVFSYSREDKDKLVMWLPTGIYLLERYQKQEKTDKPTGLWQVESLVSRGTGELWGIDFFDQYGNCIDFEKEYIEESGRQIPIKWSVKKVNREEFENQHGIREGLGLENKKIRVWYAAGAEGYSAVVIPVNEQEIICQIGAEWFKLHKVESYEETEINELEVLQGDWKFVQLLAGEAIEEEKELSFDYKAWWYGELLTFDESRYVEGNYSDWTIEEYDADTFYQEYDVPLNVVKVLGGMNTVHAAFRMFNGLEETYIILNSDTIIRERNGLWYKAVRIK